MIAAILPQRDDPKVQHPYISIQVETLDKIITTLVNLSACYNVINSKFFHTLKNVELTQNNIPAHSFTSHTTLFIGKVFLQIRVGQPPCSNYFYIMPPKGMILHMILGTPWQRKYKVAPNWETNFIQFKQEDSYSSQPFISPKIVTNHTIQT